MKIQTQFHLMIVGILIVPVLLVAAHIIYFNAEVRSKSIVEYEKIAALMDSEIKLEEREHFSRFLYEINKLGGFVLFSGDFHIIHSTIPEFTAGENASLETIVTFMNQRDERYAYSFESPGFFNGYSGHILIRRNTAIPFENQFRGFFSPVILLFALVLFIITFAIIMSLIIARSITKSVVVLENAARRIAGGELDLPLDVKGSNEITALTNSLNKMRNSIKEEERRRYRFIMGVTHDLKTPLALIKAYSEAIEDGITEDPATHASATAIINAKVDQLEGMINNLIEFVRMDTGEWRGQLSNTPIAAFLRRLATSWQTDAELLRHEFRYTIPLPESAVVPMDERLVERALENIVNNAIRYTPEGSVISFSARYVTKHYGRHDNKNDIKNDTPQTIQNDIQIEIQDNGPGIDESDLPYIFDMFYRGSASRREQGMGLGLAVVKWVTDCHGWNIAAASQKGKGASFTINIPRAAS